MYVSKNTQRITYLLFWYMKHLFERVGQIVEAINLIMNPDLGINNDWMLAKLQSWPRQTADSQLNNSRWSKRQCSTQNNSCELYRLF